jgi:hypothetical protein
MGKDNSSKKRGYRPPGQCLRCGVRVGQEGVCCKDCIAVDSRRCKELSAAWRTRYAAKRERDMLLDGLSLHGRDKGEYDKRQRKMSDSQ